MDEFIAKMSEKTGIDKATAEKVVAFLKDHSDEALKVIQSDAVKSHLPGGLGKLF